jgi:hypothetical protein
VDFVEGSKPSEEKKEAPHGVELEMWEHLPIWVASPLPLERETKENVDVCTAELARRVLENRSGRAALKREQWEPSEDEHRGRKEKTMGRTVRPTVDAESTASVMSNKSKNQISNPKLLLNSTPYT